eukprot:SM000058S18585  [mRNA]  locus=s58:629109:632084:- [translate_table: standard]
MRWKWTPLTSTLKLQPSLRSCSFATGVKLRTVGRQSDRTHMSVSPDSESENCSIDDDEEYMEAQLIDAVRMIPSRSQLFMTMANGAEVEVVHVNPTAGRLLYQSSTPTIFLRMVGQSDLMLPIVVGELAIGMLLKGLRHEAGLRPNYYELMKDLVDVLKYEVRMVRVTQRVLDTYYARVLLAKPGEKEMISVDARPSDAINLAVRCQVPIYVSKSIIQNDAVRIVHKPVLKGASILRTTGPIINSHLDSVGANEADPLAEEISLIRSMIRAANEERYGDAARMRDEIAKLRSKKVGHTKKGLSWYFCLTRDSALLAVNMVDRVL